MEAAIIRALFLTAVADRLSLFTRPMQASLFADMLKGSTYSGGTVIAFSQSGESSDILAAAMAAKIENSFLLLLRRVKKILSQQ